MSTQRVAPEAAAAQNALVALAEAADEATRDIDGERAAEVQTLGKIVRGAQLATQAVNDRLVSLDEERAQLTPPQRQIAPPVPANPAPQQVASPAAPVPPAQSGDTQQLPGALRFNEDRPPANPPAPAPEPPARARGGNTNPVNWRTPLAWGLAIVGAVLGFIVWYHTRNPVFDDLSKTFGRGILSFFYGYGLVISGFGLGGFIGETVGQWWHDNRHQH